MVENIENYVSGLFFNLMKDTMGMSLGMDDFHRLYDMENIENTLVLEYGADTLQKVKALHTDNVLALMDSCSR